MRIDFTSPAYKWISFAANIPTRTYMKFDRWWWLLPGEHRAWRATHAIAHQIGGALDLPHGLLNAILLPHVMRFNAETHAEPYVDVARALGVVMDGLDPDAAAEAAIERVDDLSRSLGIPAGLRELGVDPDDFDEFARNALRDAYITTNPRLVTEDDVRRICVAAY